MSIKVQKKYEIEGETKKYQKKKMRVEENILFYLCFPSYKSSALMSILGLHPESEPVFAVS